MSWILKFQIFFSICRNYEVDTFQVSKKKWKMGKTISSRRYRKFLRAISCLLVVIVGNTRRPSTRTSISFRSVRVIVHWEKKVRISLSHSQRKRDVWKATRHVNNATIYEYSPRLFFSPLFVLMFTSSNNTRYLLLLEVSKDTRTILRL